MNVLCSIDCPQTLTVIKELCESERLVCITFDNVISYGVICPNLCYDREGEELTRPNGVSIYNWICKFLPAHGVITIHFLSSYIVEELKVV